MVYQENDSYELNKLTDSKQHYTSNKKWNWYLIFCCLTASLASFQFGFNIASLNSPTKILKEFIKKDFFAFNRYWTGKTEYELKLGWLEGNGSKLESSRHEYESKKSEALYARITNYTRYEEIKNASEIKLKEINEKFCCFTDVGEFLENRTRMFKEKEADARPKLADAKKRLDDGLIKVNKYTEYVWIFLNSLFVLGGMIGALTSKLILDYMGRKNGILFNVFISIVSSILVFVSYYASSPVCLLVSRFLYGIQGGMACSLVPTYLNEISPGALRGQTGVMPQLFITIGILVGQILGFRQLLGNETNWHLLLAFPFIPAFLGGLAFLIFFPESPKQLLIKRYVDAAKKALQLIRGDENVDEEIRDILTEVNSTSTNENVSMIALFRIDELRWPLITSLLLQVTQQLCGINAVFFYSSSIFAGAQIPPEYIQYAIASTGIVNVIATILCVPIIDKLGRKPLLIFPMTVIIIDFVLLVVFLSLKGDIYSYLSIACILIFIVCFAVGLGPIPFIYAAECFRQNSRSSAMALNVFVNWVCALLLTMTFEYFQTLMRQYVFLIFMAIVLMSLLVILFKVPETKGKNIDQIIHRFQGKNIANDISNSNNSVQARA